MHNPCSRCETLSEAPRRADVPSHLQRVGPSPDRPRLFRYLCLTCGNAWAWSLDQGWGVIDTARRAPSHLPSVDAARGAAALAAPG